MFKLKMEEYEARRAAELEDYVEDEQNTAMDELEEQERALEEEEAEQREAIDKAFRDREELELKHEQDE